MPSHRIVGQDTSPVIYADSVSVSVFVLVVWMLLSDNKTVRLGAWVKTESILLQQTKHSICVGSATPIGQVITEEPNTFFFRCVCVVVCVSACVRQALLLPASRACQRTQNFPAHTHTLTKQ